MKQSIWEREVVLPRFPALDGDKRTDVLIVGGGLTGLLCAWNLKQAGIACMVLEADRIMGGTSGHTTAKITSQHGLCYAGFLEKQGYDRARSYFDAQEKAIAAYEKLSRQIPCDFLRQDNCVYSRESLGALEAEMEALEKLRIPARLERSLPLPVSAAGGVYFPGQARFHPLKLAAGLTKELRIYENAAVTQIRGKQAITDRGTVTAEKIIVATHFPIVNRYGGFFLKEYQHRSYVLALENAQQLDAMYLDASGNGLSFRNQGKYLLLGGGGHRTGKQGGGLRELSAAAEAYYPGAREVCRWAAQDCMSLDGMPYIGQYGKHTPGLYVATGFNKWGMTSAMLSSMILCDLVRGRDNLWRELFDPARPMEKHRLAENFRESAANLLTFRRPRCSHLGCALKWNPREHSWDCPCHGSRYSQGGSVLEGPAVRNIDPN